MVAVTRIVGRAVLDLDALLPPCTTLGLFSTPVVIEVLILYRGVEVLCPNVGDAERFVEHAIATYKQPEPEGATP